MWLPQFLRGVTPTVVFWLCSWCCWCSFFTLVVFAASACDCSSLHFGLLVWLLAVIAVYCCMWMLYVAVACLLADCSFCSFWLSIGCLVVLHLAGLLVYWKLVNCLVCLFLVILLALLVVVVGCCMLFFALQQWNVLVGARRRRRRRKIGRASCRERV